MATMSRFARKKSASGGSLLPSPATGSDFSSIIFAFKDGSRMAFTISSCGR